LPTTAIQRIIEDLLCIEVNVIIKPGMTARKMPEPHQALLDVAGDYDRFLRERARPLNQKWREAGHEPVTVRDPGAPPQYSEAGDDGCLHNDLRTDPIPTSKVKIETFGELRERAVEAEAVQRHLQQRGPGLDNEDPIIFRRIYRNCDQIKGIICRRDVKQVIDLGIGRDSAPDVSLPLTSRDIIILRKVWEVGVESVDMQTVAQLDGDIVTRINRAHADASNTALHRLHQATVETTLEHWQFLFQTIVQFGSKALQSFLSR